MEENNEELKELEELDNKLDDIDRLSNSQLDRFKKYDIVQEELLDFMSATIKKVQAEDSLKQNLIKEANERITGEDKDLISFPMIIKAIEILSKSDNELASGIFDVIKGNTKVIIESQKDDGNNTDQDNLSKEDVEIVKTVIEQLKDVQEIQNLLGGIKRSEFNKGEKEDVDG